MYGNEKGHACGMDCSCWESESVVFLLFSSVLASLIVISSCGFVVVSVESCVISFSPVSRALQRAPRTSSARLESPVIVTLMQHTRPPYAPTL